MVIRDCNDTLELAATAAGQKIPVTVPDHCIHGTFDYYVASLRFTVTVNATVCPCFSSLCNAGDITLGGNAGTGSPRTTTTTTTTTTTSRPTTTTNTTPLRSTRSTVKPSSTPLDSSTSARYDSFSKASSPKRGLISPTTTSTTSQPVGNSTPTSYKSRPTLLIASLVSAVVFYGHCAL